LDRLLLFDRAKLDEIKQKRDEKKRIIKLYSSDAIIGLKDTGIDIERLKEELNQIRFEHCRKCNHKLGCLCQICENESEKKYLLVVKSPNNTFRHAFHLHIKCAQELMNRCGHQFLEIDPLQQKL
jgi:recombinational DNA repair protein RecR